MLLFNHCRISNEDVKGILSCDEAGLHVCSRGSLEKCPGNVLTELVKLASGIEPDLPTSSIAIHFTSNNASLVILKESVLTTAVHRVEKKK